MANIKIDDIDEGKRKAVELIAAIGGFGDDYFTVSNSSYKNEMFLYNLNGLIEGRRYKSIIGMLKNEYPFMNFEKENNMISDDEKLLRRSLRGLGLGYNDDHFFNPKYDKGDLIRWDDSIYNDVMFRVRTSYKDSGANYYSLTNTDDGVEHGGMIREDDLRKPTVLEEIIYYKKQDILEVHLFNRLIPLDKVTKEDGLALIEALKGIDIDHDNEDIREIAYAAQKGFIDMRTHFNTLVMISNSSELINNPINMKLKKDSVSPAEILALEALAKNEIENIDKYRTIYNDIKSLKKDLNYNAGIEDKKLESIMVDISIAFDSSYDKLDSEKFGEAYGGAYWTIKGFRPDIFKRIESLYEKVSEFTQERDIHKLNRPDLSDLIRDAGMQLDLKRKDMIIFRGSRNETFDYYNIKYNMQELLSTPIAELNLANNGYRRELYQSPTDSHGGSNFSYCEGDLSLVVPKNKEDFITKLEHGIKFYLEDEYSEVSDEKFNEIKNEIGEKLGCEFNSLSVDECLAKVEKQEAAKSSVKTPSL